MWVKDSITSGEVDALHKAAKMAWTEQTRYPRILASNADSGQCYVTSRWLVDRLGGTVGRKQGHYVWLSSNEKFYIDLTGDHTGNPDYSENDGEYKVAEVTENHRTKMFSKRANKAFDNLESLMKVGLDYMGDPYAPQDKAIDDEQFMHDEPSIVSRESQHKPFIYANGEIVVGDSSHEDLLRQMGMDEDYSGPMAVGFVDVDRDQAVWEVETNLDLKAFGNLAEQYSQHSGWRYAGTTEVDGSEIPAFVVRQASTVRFVVDKEGYVTMGRTSHAELVMGADQAEGVEVGCLRVVGNRATMKPIIPRAVQAAHDWATDNGLTLYGADSTNPVTGPDLSEGNSGTDGGRIEETPEDKSLKEISRGSSGLYQCPACDQLFPTWREYQKHRKEEEGQSEQITKSFPDNKMDATFPTHFTEQPPRVMPVAKVEAQRVDGFRGGSEADDYYVGYHCGSPIAYARLHEGRLSHLHLAKEKDGWADYFLSSVQRLSEKEPKDLLPSPVPFIFDVEKYHITAGQPGERTSEIRGDFTKGGIVEGVYEPGGKMIIRAGTNMPYTVYGMVNLWYHTYPELTVTGVEMRDEEGGTIKMAHDEEEDDDQEDRLKNIGGYIAGLVAADPVAYESAAKLREAGGEVYAVGGVVRDAVLGEEPNDIDLMVTKLAPEKVNEALSELNGRVDLTGKDFGVFRYKNGDGEVEIALPRREQSTGEGHKDFDVQADPNMRVEDDLWRRDFTANAMAVDLSNGKLIDPYEGFRDTLSGKLRVVNPEALSEDPLRVIRGIAANSRHGLEPTPETLESMKKNGPSINSLPADRIWPELDKIMSSHSPSSGIRMAQDAGVLQYILPEVADAFGYDQNNPHHEQELGNHLLSVLDRVSEKSDDPDLRLAALLHDIGKPGSAWVDPETGSNHFYKRVLDDGTVLGANHEELGSDMTRSLMGKLRYPNDRIDRVSDLVSNHMYGPFTTPKGARKFVNKVGDHADDLLNLRWADQGGKSAYPTSTEFSIDRETELLNQVREQQAPTELSQLAVNGNDLINELGMTPGPEIGQTLESLVQRILDDPTLNERETLLGLANPSAL